MVRIYRDETVLELIELFCGFPSFPAFPWAKDQNLTAYLNFAAEYFKNKRRATNEGLPNVPFFAFRKTGSSYVNHVLANGLNIPYTMTSWYAAKAIPSWTRFFASGPGVLHDHLRPTPENLDCLQSCGLKRAIVHVRDPRQIIISLAHHVRKNTYKTMDAGTYTDRILDVSKWPLEDIIELIVEDGYPQMCGQWLDGWMSRQSDFDMLVSKYETMNSDLETFFEEILTFCGADNAVFQTLVTYMRKESEGEGNVRKGYNFRLGSADEWRQVLTPRHLAKIEHQMAGTALAELYFC